ncbi:MAG TPA: hypothetical protein VG871_15970 [Vicinamibacterales bacterium]|nr:hypothetical protein [Vicinamibacterales bacterium]
MFGEPPGFGQFRRAQSIGFVEHDDDVRHLRRDRGDEREFFAANRRVRAQHDERGVDVRHERSRFVGVPLEDGAQAGRIDEAHARGEQRRWTEDFNRRDLQSVFGVVCFRDEAMNVRGFNHLPAPILEHHVGLETRAEPEDRNRGCDRSDASREECLADEGIEQRRFASLELADDRQEEAPFEDATGQIACVTRHRVGAEFVCDGGHLLEGLDSIAGHRHHLRTRVGHYDFTIMASCSRS